MGKRSGFMVFSGGIQMEHFLNIGNAEKERKTMKNSSFLS